VCAHFTVWWNARERGRGEMTELAGECWLELQQRCSSSRRGQLWLQWPCERSMIRTLEACDDAATAGAIGQSLRRQITPPCAAPRSSQLPHRRSGLVCDYSTGHRQAQPWTTPQSCCCWFAPLGSAMCQCQLLYQPYQATNSARQLRQDSDGLGIHSAKTELLQKLAVVGSTAEGRTRPARLARQLHWLAVCPNASQLELRPLESLALC